MSHSEPVHYPDAHHDIYSRTVFGFWIYILSDFILFGAFFATYAVLRHQTFGGASAADLFHLPFTLIQTVLLLLSSFIIGLAGTAAHRRNKQGMLVCLALTALLGLGFMGMEMVELTRFIQEGHSWKESAFLSAFFTLVGTHGLHMMVAILWIGVLALPVLFQDITAATIRRVTCLRMFWQFLNLVWVFIFSFVYLMGD